MGDTTGISWTDKTFNPWWGCSRVSPACVRCYADAQAKRYGHDVWRRKGPRRMLSDANWAKPVRWNREAEAAGVPFKVFCASMADVFESHPQVIEPRQRLWGLIETTPWLIWQILTKRIENVAEMAPWGDDWPANVWLGTSVENQRYADERIPVLLDVSAKVRFLSCEPLIGAVDLRRWLAPNADYQGTSGAVPGCPGRADDRPGGPDLARISQGRLWPGEGIPPASVHRGRQAIWDRGTQGRLDGGESAFHPRGNGSQPQGRQQIEQPADEPGDSAPSFQCRPRASSARRDEPTPDSRGETDTESGSGSQGTLPAEGFPQGRDRPAVRRDGKDRAEYRDPRDVAGNRACLGWIIAGGESGGPKRREMNPAWLSSIADQCKAASVPLWVKQDSGPRSGLQGRIPDDIWCRKEFPAEVTAYA